MELNPNTLIADVINFGILAAEDFVVIERPVYRNRNRANGQVVPRNQPSPNLLPIFIPCPIIRPINYFPQQYVFLPPPCQIQIHYYVPPPVYPSVVIREINTPPIAAAPANISVVNSAQETEEPNATLPISALTIDSGVSTTDDEENDDVKKKTPYQGNRRSFGGFLCDNCLRNWKSANTWANTWQACFDCLKHVYPRWQTARRVTNNIYYCNMVSERLGYYGHKHHPQEHCGMCQSLGQNCRFVDYAPQI